MMKNQIFITILVLSILQSSLMGQECLNIGVDLEGPEYWSIGDKPFLDQMKFSSEFFAFYDWDWDNEVMDLIAVDENGYPTVGIPYTVNIPNVGMKDLKCRKMISAVGRLNLTDYVFLYDGNGTFDFTGFNVTSTSPGRIELTCNTTENAYIDILTSDPMPNHARNFRLVQAIYENSFETNIWYPPFQDKLANFHTVRFMDWFQTNDSKMVHWEDRTIPSYNTQTIKSGVAYEYAIDLCNQIDINPWVCVPHEADTNYIQQMAILFRDNLDPELDVYLEYSNEIWNFQFEQAQWIIQEPGFGITTNELYDSNQEYGWNGGLLAKRTFKLWREIFGADSLRVKRVLANQGCYSHIASQNILGCDGYFDYLSPAWYFGIEPDAPFTSSSTVEDVINSTRDEFFNTCYDDFHAHYTMAEALGKHVIHYEGGQHISAYGNTENPALDTFYAAQYSPLMYDIYDEVLDSIRAWGSHLAIAYTLAGEQENVDGSWGQIETVDIIPNMQTAPKYMALLDNLPTTECNPLAIEQIQPINAILTPSKQVLLDWITGIELDNKGFELQRSIDGISWEKIAWIPASNNNTESHYYKYIDLNPYQGINYYRYKQIDINERYSISNTVIISVYQSEVSIYPIPASKSLTICTSPKSIIDYIILYDQLGRRIANPIINNGVIDISTLHNGVYLLEIRIGNELKRKKIIVNN